MGTKSFTILLASMIFIRFGCYSRYTLPDLNPTNGEINKKVEVLTKQGQSYTLVKYKITVDRIIGFDKQGERYEEFVDNIERVSIVSKLNSKQTIIVSSFVAVLAFVLYYFFSVQGFSGLR